MYCTLDVYQAQFTPELATWFTVRAPVSPLPAARYENRRYIGMDECSPCRYAVSWSEGECYFRRVADPRGVEGQARVVQS